MGSIIKIPVTDNIDVFYTDIGQFGFRSHMT